MKTLLITGSSSGIGKATVEYFAKKGWQVVATSRKTDKKLFAEYENVRQYTLDVAKKEQIESVFKAVLKDFGRIDVIVNNAGYGQSGLFETLTEAQIRSQFETNVFGLMKVTQEALKFMKQQKAGTIIQIASMGGRLAFPNYSIYHASKWAVEGFSESLNYEVAKYGIKLKIIEPGVINTSFYTSKTKNVNKYDQVAQKAGAQGVDPQKVARVIYKAANSNSNKLRYIVGYPAPLLLFFRKILPERLFLLLIHTYFGKN